MKTLPCLIPLAAMLCLPLLSSCTTNIELPPPPLPLSSSSDVPGSSGSEDASSSGGAVPGSSAVVSSSSAAVPVSSSAQPPAPSSSSSIPSSSSALSLSYSYCVFIEERICLLGPWSSCPSGGVLSNSCPYDSSSSAIPVSSSSTAYNSSSSVVLVLSSSSAVPISSSIAPSSSSVPVVLPSSSSLSGASGTFEDNRDNKSYRWVKIGAQIWMAENLNYNASGSKCGNGSSLSDANTATCITYGRLYNWVTAMNLPSSCNFSTCSSQVGAKHQGVCPAGWHLPSNAEWDSLYRYADGSTGTSSPYSSSTAGWYLKATSGWNNSGNGKDSYGFSALPGGRGFSDDHFGNAGEFGYWWSSSEFVINNAYLRLMGCYGEGADWGNWDEGYLLSVRCLQD